MTDEAETLEHNIKALRKVSQSLSESIEAYHLMTRVYKSESAYLPLEEAQ